MNFDKNSIDKSMKSIAEVEMQNYDYSDGYIYLDGQHLYIIIDLILKFTDLILKFIGS